MRQNLEHRAAGFNHTVRRQSLAQQHLARDVAVRQVHVGDVIDNDAVDFFGHALVEAPVSGFHVKDRDAAALRWDRSQRSEEHTSELQSLMRISYAVFCLKKKKKTTHKK